MTTQAKIYEVEPGLDALTAPLVGVPEGPSFHFVLNNKIYKDNRIPPRGFANAAFAAFGGTPVGAQLRRRAVLGRSRSTRSRPAQRRPAVTLYYQSTSKEYIEFLRDQNTTNTTGQALYDLWDNNGKCPPEVMVQSQVTLAIIWPGDIDLDGHVNTVDVLLLAECWGTHSGDGGYNVEADADGDGDIDVVDLLILADNFGK